MIHTTTNASIKALLSFLAAFGSSQVLADVLLDPGTSSGGVQTASVTWITNQILPRDYEALRDISRNIPSDTTWYLSLNSSGGDIQTSLNIGRLLRERSASANVGANAKCLSACVFILAGATQRAVLSHLGAIVGIHRPYDPNDRATTLAAQREKQQEWERHIRKFLSEVNVPASLYDEMIRVSPSEVRMLSPSELKKYALSTNDPYWDDAKDTKAADALGLSKLEYLDRKARARSVCPRYLRPGKLFDDLICEENVLRGLPPSTNLQ